MDQKLTNEQRALIEENHNFIYYFLHKHNLSIADWYDVCAIGMCNAAINFRPEKGSQFLTFAGICLLNEVRYEMRRENRKRRKGECYSLDQTVPGTEGLKFSDTIASSESLEDSVLQRVQLRQGMDSLSERERKVLMMATYASMTQTDIGKSFGKSQVWAYRILTKAKNKLYSSIA